MNRKDELVYANKGDDLLPADLSRDLRAIVDGAPKTLTYKFKATVALDLDARRLLEDLATTVDRLDAVAKKLAVTDVCPCGMARVDCEYHR